MTPDRLGRTLAVAGSTAVLVGALLGWGRSGETMRSSFELVSLTERLDVLGSAGARFAAIWFSLPVLVGLVWLAASRPGVRPLAALATATAVLGAAGVAAVALSPLEPGPGLVVTSAGAALGAAGVAALLKSGNSLR